MVSSLVMNIFDLIFDYSASSKKEKRLFLYSLLLVLGIIIVLLVLRFVFQLFS